jgi:hypothetical protein
MKYLKMIPSIFVKQACLFNNYLKQAMVVFSTVFFGSFQPIIDFSGALP